MAQFDLAKDLSWRSLIYQVTSPELLETLARASKDPLKIYIGFDPTAKSLHIGSLLQLCLLKRFQRFGHKVVVLLGGATGMVGDPSGKSTERPMLERSAIKGNVEAIRHQVNAILGEAEVVDNSLWWEKMDVISYLRDVGKYATVNQMFARDSVRSRIKASDEGISYTEFSYMLLQAYDFLYLYDNFGCNLQCGASDQWGNIVQGVDLIRRCRKDANIYGMTTPLVVKADGTKFGKSESGSIWLSKDMTSPYELHQYLLRVEDSQVITYLKYFTFLEEKEISELEKETVENPSLREGQKRLADEVLAIVHGIGEVKKANEAAKDLFGSKDYASFSLDDFEALSREVPTYEAESSKFISSEYQIADLCLESGLTSSKGEARRLATQGGLYINGSRVQDALVEIKADLLIHGKYLVLRSGKSKTHLVKAI
ncbi:MAG: tyrosine--tRNA ligase [Acidimicrobiales bacterium]|nr:tyrosine--tRNA ligase [Acidimicrobiales bacterium]